MNNDYNNINNNNPSINNDPNNMNNMTNNNPSINNDSNNMNNMTNNNPSINNDSNNMNNTSNYLNINMTANTTNNNPSDMNTGNTTVNNTNNNVNANTSNPNDNTVNKINTGNNINYVESNKVEICCSRCGAVMNNNSRYCMKCGNLNMDHAANNDMKKFIDKKHNKPLYQPNGNYLNTDSGFSIANNTGSFLLCFLFNYFIYVVALVLVGLYYYQQADSDINLFINSKFYLIEIAISFGAIYAYSSQLIYMKCNKRWWSSLVPIFNIIVFSNITFGSSFFAILFVIPITSLVALYQLGKHFSKSGLLTMLLPVIYIPVIGFGFSTYKGRTYVTANDSRYLEKEYRCKKLYLFTFFLVLISCVGLCIYDNVSISKYIDEVKNIKLVDRGFYTDLSERMVKKVKNVISAGLVLCKDGQYSYEDGVYYFVFTDVEGELYLSPAVKRAKVKGYVKVERTLNITNYYVSLSDGKYGFEETEYSNINKKTIKEYNVDVLEGLPESNICYVIDN